MGKLLLELKIGSFLLKKGPEINVDLILLQFSGSVGCERHALGTVCSDFSL